MSRQTDTVLVTGATGRIGRRVIAELLRCGAPVRALTRRPNEAQLPPGVEVVQGDLTAPESLDAALDGAVAVFLLWTAAPATVPEVINRIAMHNRRIVFLSSPHQTAHPFFQQSPFNPMAVLHRNIEEAIARSAIDATILRPGMFASNALHWWAPSIRNRDPVRWVYGSAETAPIDELDIAAVAARTLLDASHAKRDYVLTGPASLSQAQQVRIIGDVIGREIAFEDLSPEDFRHQIAPAWPAPIADMLLGAWSAALGQPAFVTNAVADILGSPAHTFLEWVADNASAFD